MNAMTDLVFESVLDLSAVQAGVPGGPGDPRRSRWSRKVRTTGR